MVSRPSDRFSLMPHKSAVFELCCQLAFFSHYGGLHQDRGTAGIESRILPMFSTRNQTRSLRSSLRARHRSSQPGGTSARTSSCRCTPARRPSTPMSEHIACARRVTLLATLLYADRHSVPRQGLGVLASHAACNTRCRCHCRGCVLLHPVAPLITRPTTISSPSRPMALSLTSTATTTATFATFMDTSTTAGDMGRTTGSLTTLAWRMLPTEASGLTATRKICTCPETRSTTQTASSRTRRSVIRTQRSARPRVMMPSLLSARRRSAGPN
eukprot:COSAG02_NODE_1711_length_11223_cov_5.622348_11_plen_271_part_00